MNEQIRNLLLVGGLLGAGYYMFNRYTSQALPIATTRKIAQEIKHQILIVSISFAQGSIEHIESVRKNDSSKVENLIEYFRNKMGEIYGQKEELILGKYGIPREKYASSLQLYSKDQKLAKIQNQILDMMEKSIRGELPDFTVDKRATEAFTKDQIQKIYEDMSKMILVALVSRLQKEKKNNSDFDSHNDAQFKTVVRQLNIYDKKIEFFKARGFKEEWGCPNETFFKISQNLKIKDPKFKKQMLRLEQIYQKIVDDASKHPESVNLQNLNDYYLEKAEEPKVQKKVVEKPHHKIEAVKSNIVHKLKVAQKQEKQAKKEQQKQEKQEKQEKQAKKEQQKQEKQKKQAKKEQQKQEKQEKQEKQAKKEQQKRQETNFVNLQKSTLSQPPNQLPHPIPQAPQQKPQPHHNIDITRTQSAIEPTTITGVKEEEQAPSVHVQIDDVPNDAHELNLQLHPEDAVQAQAKKEHEELADSNASLDAEPIGNQQPKEDN